MQAHVSQLPRPDDFLWNNLLLQLSRDGLPIVRSLVRVLLRDRDFTKLFVLPVQNATISPFERRVFLILIERHLQIGS